MSDIELHDEFLDCLKEMEDVDQPLFITGRAGTGKSTLLSYFVKNTSKKVVVLAPTGIAALHVGGQTIHSFFGFPPRPLKRNELRRSRSKIYTKIELLIIDEISMVRADMLDQIDQFLQINRSNSAPFGGLKVIFFGDLFQLPPIVRTPEERALFSQVYSSPYFFSAKVFDSLFVQLQMIELQTVYRQKELSFVRLLDNIRMSRIDYDDLETINQRVCQTLNKEGQPIVLSARNASVDAMNQKALAALDTQEFQYIASSTGTIQSIPAETPLRLKVGAQVMMLINDPKRRFVNGSIGTVLQLEPDRIQVAIDQGDGVYRTIDIEKFEWNAQKYDLNAKGEIETKVVGTYQQYPIRLAWAITIHKSQGKTFERVIIDMGKGAFAPGQTYVALSRCKTLDGIQLKVPLKPRDIMVDPRVLDFYMQHR